MSGVRARRSSGKHALRPIGLAKYTLDRERVDVDEARERPLTPTQLDRLAYADNMQIGLLSVARLLSSGTALRFWEVRL